MVLAPNGNVFEFLSSIGLSYTRHSTNHIVQEARRKIPRKAEKKKKKLKETNHNIWRQANNIGEKQYFYLLSTLRQILFQLLDYLTRFSKDFITIIHILRVRKLSHTEIFKNAPNHIVGEEPGFLKIQTLSIYHLNFTTAIEETGSNDLFTKLGAHTVLEAISFKHKKVILMGSTEKLPKSFYLCNKSQWYQNSNNHTPKTAITISFMNIKSL